MSYAFIQDVPASDEIYTKIRALLPARAPAGLVTHVVQRREGGLRYIDVWSSEREWERFRLEHVEPAVEQVLASYGIPHDESLTHAEVIDVIDVWQGEPLS
jgi:hypothetical protein